MIELAINLPVLGVPSYWQDEAASLSAARRPFGALRHLLRHTDVVHGLYYAFLHVWLLAGDGEWWVRLPSALAFAGTVWFTVACALALGGTRSATVAAVVVLVLPGIAWTAVDARPSAFAALFVSAAMYQLLRVDGPRTARSAVCWLVAVLLQLTALLHLPAWLLSARRGGRPDSAGSGVGRWGVGRRGGGWWRAVLAAAVVVLAALPLALAARGQSAQIDWISHSTGSALSSALLTQPVDGAHSALLGSSYEPVERALGYLLVAVALGYLVVIRDLRLPVWAYGAGVFAALANAVGVHVYLARYFASSAPAFAVMAGVLAAHAGRRWATGATAVAGVVFLAGAVPLWAAQRTPTGHWSEDLRTDASVVRHASGALVVYADPSARSVADAYPDALHGHQQVPPSASVGATLWGPLVHPNEVVTAARGHTAVLVIGRRTSHRVGPDVAALERAGRCAVVRTSHEHRLRTVLLHCRT